jgi:hypothetical protein
MLHQPPCPSTLMASIHSPATCFSLASFIACQPPFPSPPPPAAADSYVVCYTLGRAAFNELLGPIEDVWRYETLRRVRRGVRGCGASQQTGLNQSQGYWPGALEVDLLKILPRLL